MSYSCAAKPGSRFICSTECLGNGDRGIAREWADQVLLRSQFGSLSSNSPIPFQSNNSEWTSFTPDPNGIPTISGLGKLCPPSTGVILSWLGEDHTAFGAG